jgi:Signal transduction histidine kinase
LQPAETSQLLIRTAETRLERQTALLRRRQNTSWPGREASRRLLQTMSESLRLLRRAELQMLSSACAKPSALELAVAQAVERERQRIARELHDTVGQQLCAMRLTMADAHKSRQAGLLHKRLALLESLIAAADVDLDRAVFSLHPPALGQQGLAEAVRQHVSHWSGLFGVPVDLLITGLEHHAPAPAVTAAAYRIVQECLTNIAKHARASRVGVALSVLRGQLQLSIEDDGAGFDMDAAPRGRLGLVGMGERVAALQGRFEVESAPGQGTTVLVTLPLHPRLHPRQAAGEEAEAAPLGD